MELVFKDTQYAFQTLRALGYAVSGGADVGEVLKTAYSIKEGDDESWYREWMKTAEQREKAGDDFLARRRKISAKQEFFKASNYYRTAEFFLHTNPEIDESCRSGRKAGTASEKRQNWPITR